MIKIKGLLALLACAIIYGSMGIYIRFLSQEMTVYQQVGLRNTVAFVVAIGIALILKQSFNLNGVNKRDLVVYSFSFPLSVICFTFSILNTKVGTTVFGFYVSSIISSLVIGNFFFKEKITLTKMIGISVSLIGLLTYLYPFQATAIFNVGLLFSFVSGILDSTANGFRKFLSGKIDRFVLVAMQTLAGVSIATTAMIWSGHSLMPSISGTTFFIGVWFGLMVLSISYLTLVGFQNFDLSLGTVVISAELFFALVFAQLFLGERPSITELAGTSLIMLAIIILNVDLAAWRPKSWSLK